MKHRLESFVGFLVIEMDGNNYTRPKTVRFDPDTFRQIEIDASDGGITTSEYIRSLVTEAVAGIELPEGA